MEREYNLKMDREEWSGGIENIRVMMALIKKMMDKSELRTWITNPTRRYLVAIPSLEKLKFDEVVAKKKFGEGVVRHTWN